jgi:hypothetical protein
MTWELKMVVRLGAAVLLTGLAFATPSLAEMPAMESSYSLDLREGEGPVLLSLDGAPDIDTVLAQLPAVDLPVAIEETSFNVFAAREDSENFSWMTADLLDNDNLTTGSVLKRPAFQRVVGDHADSGDPIAAIMSPLTDDALRALELTAP